MKYCQNDLIRAIILFLLNISPPHLCRNAEGCLQKIMHVYTSQGLLFNQLPITLEHPWKDVGLCFWDELSSAKHEKREERRASVKEHSLLCLSLWLHGNRAKHTLFSAGCGFVQHLSAHTITFW